MIAISQQSFDNKQTGTFNVTNKAGINIEACEGNNITKLDNVLDKIIASQDSTILILENTKVMESPVSMEKKNGMPEKLMTN